MLCYNEVIINKETIMLLNAVKKLNRNVKIEDLAKVSGLSAVRLYEINKSPEKKNLKLSTVEAIYAATFVLCGRGLTPDDYLIGTKLPFKN